MAARRSLNRTFRELYFVKRFFWPANAGELFRCLTQYVEPNGLSLAGLLKTFFSNFPHDRLRYRDILRDEALESRFVNYCLENYGQSNSQLFQDLLVLFFLGEKQGGYFVEFGAGNGIDLSNSFQLEKRFGWRGIVAEPARTYQPALKANRNCNVDFRCVWHSSGELLDFREADSPQFSTVRQFCHRDMHGSARTTGKNYAVNTVSLNDLLRAHGAPYDIDYLSIDTEGSEFDILNHFDFRARNVRIVTVEHNYVDRWKLRNLMTDNGFVQVFEDLSRFDDWYVNPELIR